MITCNVENFTADISVDEYIRRFRDEERFIGLCRQCSNFGNCWACPPFSFDTGEELRRYKYARIMAARITPAGQNIPLGEAQALIRPERMRIEAELRAMEHRYGGRALAFAGQCLYCASECARRCNMPCRHPDKVRPSLEAFGFDISRTLSELFGLRLLWGKDGHLPDYLILVSALLHNNRSLTL